MSTASGTPGDLRTGVVDPPGPEQQQPQITAVTNGGVSIVPNSINDGPLVHMGVYTPWSPFAHANAMVRPGRKAPSLPWPDIGPLGKWSVSSYKFGFGAECLNDDDPETFWQ